MRRLARTAIALALLGGALVGTSTPAAAHSQQTGSSPKAGATLSSPPTKVFVTFGSPLMDVGAALVVRAVDGTIVSADTSVISRNRITTKVRTDGPAGLYTVAYRIVSEDGHTVTSTFTYTVEGSSAEPSAAASAPAPAPSPDTSPDPSPDTSPDPSAVAPVQSGTPPWVLAIVVLAIIIGAAIMMARVARRR